VATLPELIRLVNAVVEFVAHNSHTQSERQSEESGQNQISDGVLGERLGRHIGLLDESNVSLALIRLTGEAMLEHQIGDALYMRSASARESSSCASSIDW